MSAPERIREESLSELLQAWRADVNSVPVPRLVSTETPWRWFAAREPSMLRAGPLNPPTAQRPGTSGCRKVGKFNH